MVNNNFRSIIWLCGHFGVIIREHIEEIVYRGKYGNISSNTTLAKLEKHHNLIKRIERGKRKSDAFKLTPLGSKEFIRFFGYEPKVFNSLDKLNHSIKIVDFYCSIIKDMVTRGIIDNLNILDDRSKLSFIPHMYTKFTLKNKELMIIPDAFGIYKYRPNTGLPFFLEIENSEQRASNVAIKTVKNYEGYYLSGLWKKEKWQPDNVKIFPKILIVTYSEMKALELARWINKKRNMELVYYFTSYGLLEKKGLSSMIWYDLSGKLNRIIG